MGEKNVVRSKTKVPAGVFELLVTRGSEPRSAVPERIIERVKEFIDVFEPGEGSLGENVELWKTLIEEEMKEVMEAETYEDLAKEIADLHYVVAGHIIECRAAGCPVVHPAGAADICYSTTMLLGSVLESMVDEVHRSNMTKLGEDGKPIRREDGKVLKGPNYKEADMSVFGPVLESVVKAIKWKREK